MPANPSILTVSGSAGTAIYPMDWNKLSPFNYGVQTAISSAGIAYTIDITADNISSGLGSSQANWSTLLSTTANSYLQVVTPSRWLRVNVTSASSNSTTTATVISAG